MDAAVRGAWGIMAIHREGKEVAGVEIMEAMAAMTEEGGITNLQVLNELTAQACAWAVSCKPVW